MKEFSNNLSALDDFTVIAFTADLWQHVCPVIRIVRPLEQAGLRWIKGAEWAEGELRFDAELIRDADIVLVARDFPWHIEAYEQVVTQARLLNKRLVYELDDLLTELPEEHPDYEHYRPARPAMLRAMLEADAVIGSTPALCEYAQSYNPRTFVFPNYLDDQLWSLRPPIKGIAGPVTIGYMGGHSHASDLKPLAPLLARLVRRYGNQVRLKFWGIVPPPILQNEPDVEWEIPGLVSYAEFAAYFEQQSCDIFLAPLNDNIFNRCKSHLKFLEYSALGIPGIYSRITSYESIVRHGENGLLASSANEWEESLARLIEDPELRFRLAVSAQETVRSQWLLSEHAGNLAEILEKVIQAPPRAEQSSFAIKAARKMQLWQAGLEVENRSLKDHLHALEHQTRAQVVQLEEKEKAFQNANAAYTELVNSRSWRLVQILQRIRLKLIPRGGRLERLLSLSMHAPGVYRREGMRSFLRSAWREMRSISSPAPALSRAQPGYLHTIATLDATQCHLPAVTVVILLAPWMPAVSEQAVAAWLGAQSYPQLAYIAVWELPAGMARLLGSRDDKKWRAVDMQAFLDGLSTPYVCMASQDLLEQEQTYLEANLLALESEALAFTINLRSQAAWAVEQLAQGNLPGETTLPLLRQIARRDCLGENFSLDLSAWLANHGSSPRVAGKALWHTSYAWDVQESLPFRTQIYGGEVTFEEMYFLAGASSGEITQPVLHGIRPVDAAVPAEPVPSALPTVVMVMPFLAMGGAEQIHLQVMCQLKGRLRFAVVTCEPLDPELGTTADAFRRITPFVYTLPDYLDPQAYFSFMLYLFARLNPSVLYIANGATWIYNVLGDLKRRFPDLRIANQVYDARVGWINRYDLDLVMYIDAHIGVNDKICQAYAEKGASPEEIYLIENGIDSHEMAPAIYTTGDIRRLKEKFGLPQGKRVITFASRFHQQKRPLDFVELARRFALDDSTVFFMVGDGPLASVVDEQIRKVNLQNVVRLPFYRPIRDVLAVSNVLVLPSEFEGMPMIVIEAQAMGVPVVVTDVGNNRQVLERTAGGVVVNRIGDVTQLMEGVRQMLTAPPEPGRLRQATLEYFDIALIAQKYYDVLIGRD